MHYLKSNSLVKNKVFHDIMAYHEAKSCSPSKQHLCQDTKFHELLLRLDPGLKDGWMVPLSCWPLTVFYPLPNPNVGSCATNQTIVSTDLFGNLFRKSSMSTWHLANEAQLPRKMTRRKSMWMRMDSPDKNLNNSKDGWMNRFLGGLTNLLPWCSLPLFLLDHVKLVVGPNADESWFWQFNAIYAWKTFYFEFEAYLSLGFVG